jgi:hypothetical protein
MATVPVVSGGYIYTPILNPDRFPLFFTKSNSELERFHKGDSLIGNSAPLLTPSSPSEGQISSIGEAPRIRGHSLEALDIFRAQCDHIFH